MSSRIQQEISKIKESMVELPTSFKIYSYQDTIKFSTPGVKNLFRYTSPLIDLSWNVRVSFDMKSLKLKVDMQEDRIVQACKNKMNDMTLNLIERHGGLKNNKLSSLYKFYAINGASLINNEKLQDVFFELCQLYGAGVGPNEGLIATLKFIKDKHENDSELVSI